MSVRVMMRSAAQAGNNARAWKTHAMFVGVALCSGVSKFATRASTSDNSLCSPSPVCQLVHESRIHMQSPARPRHTL